MEHHLTYPSVLALAEASEPGNRYNEGKITPGFNGVSSREEAHDLAVNGWQDQSEEVLSLVESAVESVAAEFNLPAFRSVWDVSGCEVDVGRYLAGEPENMIDYEMVATPRSGRVITLVASAAYSGSISTETIKERGLGIAALAMALGRLGFATELWSDWSVSNLGGGKGETMGRVRTLVKGPNDELDVSRIMFAYAHPAMLRVLYFDAIHQLPQIVHGELGIGRNYGYPTDPKEDLPEGTIYLPSVRSGYDVPEARDLLIGHLRSLGIIEG